MEKSQFLLKKSLWKLTDNNTKNTYVIKNDSTVDKTELVCYNPSLPEQQKQPMSKMKDFGCFRLE
ncbi:MAG: hypothetical protein MJ137_00940, partial [Clostridia bacterium]|nr:hypothetical protein [Clostridia bacterium]